MENIDKLWYWSHTQSVSTLISYLYLTEYMHLIYFISTYPCQLLQSNLISFLPFELLFITKCFSNTILRSDGWHYDHKCSAFYQIKRLLSKCNLIEYTHNMSIGHYHHFTKHSTKHNQKSHPTNMHFVFTSTFSARRVQQSIPGAFCFPLHWCVLSEGQAPTETLQWTPVSVIPQMLVYARANHLTQE